MSNLAFDTHKFVKDLTRNGMPDKQAEVLADHYASLLTDRLATKEDLFGLDQRLSQKIGGLRTELKGDVKSLRTELKGDIKSLCTELKSDINSLRTELKGDIEALRKDMMITILSAQLVGIVTISAVVGLMVTL